MLGFAARGARTRAAVVAGEPRRRRGSRAVPGLLELRGDEAFGEPLELGLARRDRLLDRALDERLERRR